MPEAGRPRPAAAHDCGAAVLVRQHLPGFLARKYSRGAGAGVKGDGRLESLQSSNNLAFTKLFTERNWEIVDVLKDVARELGRPPAQVALNWVTRRPGIASTIIGATRLDQLAANMRGLEFELPAALAARLETIGRPELVHPYFFFDPSMRGMLTGGTSVRAEPRGYRPRD